LADAYRDTQKGIIEKAFQVRALECEERNVPIPFVLFPEASIPLRNPDGLECIATQMENVHDDVIFIGGLEAISPQEAQELSRRFPPEIAETGLSFSGGAFINVCVIAVKPSGGRLSWYFQAKLRPSQWEQPRNMANGRRVLYFVAPRAVFLCEICFDQIAAQGEEHLNSVLCNRICRITEPNGATLDFVFVPQIQRDPEHTSVKQNTRILLHHQDRLLNNMYTAVVVVNKAASEATLGEYGRSGLHYKGDRWRISMSDLGPKGYALREANDVTSAIFRRRAGAIHVVTLVPSTQNMGDSGNPRIPLENPRSYLPTDDTESSCACLAGRVCGAGKFLECDSLPCSLSDILPVDLPNGDVHRRWQTQNPEQSQALAGHFEDTRKILLKLGCDRASQVMSLLMQMHEPSPVNPDLWSKLQSDAVVEFIAVLSLFAEVQPIDFHTESLWSVQLGDSLALVIVDGHAIYAWTEIITKYMKHFEQQYYRPEKRRNPVLLAAIRSQGLVQPLIRPFVWDFTKSLAPERLGDDKSFAEPTRLRLFVCQDALFHGARQEGTIAEFLGEQMRCLFE
jgi:hypothetical protein